MSLVRHKISGRIGKIVDKENHCAAIRYMDDNELRWEHRDSLEPYDPPGFVDLSIRMTVKPEDASKVSSLVNTMDTSGMSKIYRLNNGIWEGC